MRKSLLMTSALGLVMPALAMASSVAGSSAAACGSGFFAQFDAKIMNAKLEIKNENTKQDEQSDASVEADLIAAQEKALAKAEILFAGFSPAQTTKLRNTIANGGLNITRLLNATSDRQIEVIVLHALKGGADDLASLLNDAGGAAIAAPTAAQLDAVTPAQIDAALAAVAAVPAAANTLTVSAGVAQSITRAQFDKAVADAKRLKAAIEADKEETARIKAIPGGTYGFADILAVGALRSNRNLFNKKTVLSTQGDADANITISNAARHNLAEFDNIFVLAGSAIGAAGVARTFELARTDFLNTGGGAGGLKELRANALKAEGWFNDAVQVRKSLIAKSNELVKKNNEFADRRVHHHALAGGVGATVGWWQNLGGFALSISGSGDYLWGTFRMADDASGTTVDAKNKRKLGFGFQGDVGVHYVVSPSTTLGVLVGLRGQQLNIGRTDKTQTTNKDSKGDYTSKWMINPVVSMQARTFFTDTVYGALSVGYIIPIEKDYKLENTNITNKDAKIRFQGLTGAFSVGMMF